MTTDFSRISNARVNLIERHRDRSRNNAWAADFRCLQTFIVPAMSAIAIVTGANTGVGFQVARRLFERGFTVIMACRSQSRAQKAQAKILRQQSEVSKSPAVDKRIITLPLDLASFDSIAKFHEEMEVHRCFP